ncbi:MAG: hypothetical protein U0S50_08920 [Sphingopyxis sp.]|uniref:hypothetical protein n=1 Tax=Sphingopyxis sp. TaxID=1908224 RepID=UPI002ABB36F2|nr:hypothetical protein [Sphingopyxis sp.]MDZ3831921.1 hypothetical protein [Sphingopyxis sp.]
MTFMLLLGAAAGLYLIWLLFRLAAIALPCVAGVVVALQLLDRGFGHGAAIGAGFAAGLILLLAGRHLYASGGSIVTRLLVALAFAIPAGIAGYHAMKGVSDLASAGGGASTFLSLAGAFVAAVAAIRSLGTGPVGPESDGPAPTQPAPQISPL